MSSAETRFSDHRLGLRKWKFCEQPGLVLEKWKDEMGCMRDGG